MKRNKKIIIAVVGAIAVLSATAAVRKAGSARQASAQAAAPSVVEFLQSDLVQAGTHDLQVALPLSGSLRALNQASVKAKVSGEVQQVLVREGEAVRAGQVIVRIDPTEYDAKVAQARGQMLAARGSTRIRARPGSATANWSARVLSRRLPSITTSPTWTWHAPTWTRRRVAWPSRRRR